MYVDIYVDVYVDINCHNKLLRKEQKLNELKCYLTVQGYHSIWIQMLDVKWIRLQLVFVRNLEHTFSEAFLTFKTPSNLTARG